jgi:hypothetical protein
MIRTVFAKEKQPKKKSRQLQEDCLDFFFRCAGSGTVFEIVFRFSPVSKGVAVNRSAGDGGDQ